ncbi:MAG: hypothetical protein ACREAU_04140 [Nitrosopumilaceae archaeon]
MKLKDLFEQQRVIEGDLDVTQITKLDDNRGAILKGHFLGSGSRITSLEGSPEEVTGDFICSLSGITSLKGAPKRVGRGFMCLNTNIKSLEGAPYYVGGYFDCSETNITSLEGAPSYVGSYFACHDTKITSFHNIHKQIKHIGGILTIDSAVKSHIMGLMLIKNLKIEISGVKNKQLKQAIAIMNKHLAGRRNIHDCQEELIEAGLSEYAKL